MRIWSMAVIAIAAGVMLQPIAPAQSVWQRMKQAAKQAEQNAEARSRQQQIANHPASSRPAQQAQAASQPASPPADLSSSAMKALFRKLDVGGAQIGMRPQEASAVLLRRNPSFLEQRATPFAFTDLPNVKFTSQVAFSGRDEKVVLGLALQPMQPEVLSIFRSTSYEIDHQPTAVNTVAALRAKYGPESLLEDSPSANEIFILWIYDGGANLVSKARAEKIRTCGVNFRDPSVGYIDHDALIPHWNTDCEPYTIMKAILKTSLPNMLNSRGQSLPPGLLSSLNVVVVSNPLFTKTVLGARQMVLAAKAANLQQTKKAADKNAPSL